MELTKRMVRTGIAAVVAIACAFVLVVGLSGCGKSDEEQVKEVLTTELDAFKNVGDEAKQIFEQAGGSSLEAMGIDGEAFLNGWLEGFDYTIGDITIDGDKATANVNITAKKLMSAITAFIADFQNWAATATNMTEDQAMAKAGELIMEDVQKEEAASTDVQITLEKKNGQWAIDSSGEAALIDVVVGDTSSLGL